MARQRPAQGLAGKQGLAYLSEPEAQPWLAALLDEHRQRLSDRNAGLEQGRPLSRQDHPLAAAQASLPGVARRVRQRRLDGKRRQALLAKQAAGLARRFRHDFSGQLAAVQRQGAVTKAAHAPSFVKAGAAMEKSMLMRPWLPATILPRRVLRRSASAGHRRAGGAVAPPRWPRG